MTWTRTPSRLSVCRVCVATPLVGAVSETFITNHIERLPTSVGVLHGSPPSTDENGTSVYSVRSRVWHRVVRKVRRRCFGAKQGDFYSEAVAAYLKSRNVGVLLAEYGPTGVRLLEGCRRAGVPLVVHFHGYDAYVDRVLAQYGDAYRQMFRVAAGVIAVSRDMERQLLRLGCPPDKLYYIPYGVNTAMFNECEPEQHAPHFLAVGRFVEKKAPYLTILAFGKVLQTVPDARLTMVGDGILLGPCRQIAAALGLTDSIKFLGARPHDEVAALMKRSRAFLQHSIRPTDGNSEGTPVAVIEAQASGLPVIATGHAGIADVVVDEETGLLVDEHDVTGMAKQMLRVAEEPALAARLGRAGRKRVEAHFSMERSIGRLWAILEACIEGRRPKFDDEPLLLEPLATHPPVPEAQSIGPA